MTKIYDSDTLTRRGTVPQNSHYIFGGSKLARATALQDIKQHCKETKQKSYLFFIGVNPKTFIKKYIDITICLPYILSEGAMQYLKDFYDRQKQQQQLKDFYDRQEKNKRINSQKTFQKVPPFFY